MRRRYFGKSRAWTEWADTGNWCNSSGVLGQADCNGTVATTYRHQVRYFQYADGTGRTATEYRAGQMISSEETAGLCGVHYPRTELVYYGYGYDDNRGWRVCWPEAFSSGITGSIWMGDDSTQWYTSEFGSEHAAPGYVMTVKNATWETSQYQRVYMFSD